MKVSATGAGASSEHTVRIERVLESDYGTTTFHGISAAVRKTPCLSHFVAY